MLLKLIFWPIKLLLKLVLWILMMPVNIALAPLRLAFRILQMAIFAAIVGVIIFIIVQYA